MTRTMKLFLALQIILLFINCKQKVDYDVNSIDKQNNARSNLVDQNNVLDTITSFLNNSIKGYVNPLTAEDKFSAKSDGVILGVTIYDLTDVTNSNPKKVKFINNHFYHVAPIEMPWSFSNIIYIENGKVIIFKALNCKEKGDDLNDVIAFFEQKHADDEKAGEILERIKNYRNFGLYNNIDSQSSLNCNYWHEK